MKKSAGVEAKLVWTCCKYKQGAYEEEVLIMGIKCKRKRKTARTGTGWKELHRME